jgi:hypothetical protein
VVTRDTPNMVLTGTMPANSLATVCNESALQWILTFHVKKFVYFPLLRLFQRIHWSARPRLTFRNMPISSSLAVSPIPQAGGSPPCQWLMTAYSVYSWLHSTPE